MAPSLRLSRLRPWSAPIAAALASAALAGIATPALAAPPAAAAPATSAAGAPQADGWVQITPDPVRVKGHTFKPTCSAAPGTNPTYSFWFKPGTADGLVVFFNGGVAAGPWA